MIDMNGVREIIDIFEYLESKMEKLRYDCGVLQSIGYKEFVDFYNLYKQK